MPVVDALSLSGVIAGANGLAGAFAYLHRDQSSRPSTAGPPMDQNATTLRRDVSKALEAAASRVKFLKLTPLPATAPASFKVALPQWVLRAEACLAAVRERLFGQMVRHLAELTNAVIRDRPGFDTYINDECFNQRMAEKHLLKWAGRQAFSVNTRKLGQAARNLRALHFSLAIATPLCDHELAKAALHAADIAFKSGLMTVRVIAACSVLQQGKGVAREQEASQIKREGLPKTLAAALDAVAAQAQAPTAGSTQGAKRKAQAGATQEAGAQEAGSSQAARPRQRRKGGKQ